MFCPVGFRSAAELWEEFLARRFESIYIETTQGYHRPDYQAFFTRGSPVDVCEHVFLKSLSTVGFHISSPTGDVLRLHVRMQDGKPNLFSTARIYQSALWAAAIEIEGEGKPSYDALEKANFRHGTRKRRSIQNYLRPTRWPMMLMNGASEILVGEHPITAYSITFKERPSQF